MAEMTTTETAPDARRDRATRGLGVRWGLSRWRSCRCPVTRQSWRPLLRCSVMPLGQPEVGEVVAARAVPVRRFADAAGHGRACVDRREEVRNDVGAAVVIDMRHLMDEVGALGFVELGDGLGV